MGLGPGLCAQKGRETACMSLLRVLLPTSRAQETISLICLTAKLRFPLPIVPLVILLEIT